MSDAASKAQYTPNFFADVAAMGRRITALEITLPTLMPQDQPSSVRKAVLPPAYDGTQPTLPNGLSTLLAAAGVPITMTYTPTRNAWWVCSASAMLQVVTSGNQYGVLLGLSPADTDIESSAQAYTNVTSGVSPLWSPSLTKQWSLQAGITYTCALQAFNVNNNPSATYFRQPFYTWLSGFAIPRR